MGAGRADSPFGPLTLLAEDGAVTGLRWGQGPDSADPLLAEAAGQIAAYFAGRLRRFDLPLAPRVSDFQKGFLAALSAIPFGETRTYGALARQFGISAQAAGQACGANPIPIIIPCHRVLGAASLGGFSAPGGVETKVALLRLEGAAGLLI
jgi:methylated-DNA-[protein]-cysteine S-methyltransferase